MRFLLGLETQKLTPPPTHTICQRKQFKEIFSEATYWSFLFRKDKQILENQKPGNIKNFLS